MENNVEVTMTYCPACYSVILQQDEQFSKCEQCGITVFNKDTIKQSVLMTETEFLKFSEKVIDKAINKVIDEEIKNIVQYYKDKFIW